MNRLTHRALSLLMILTGTFGFLAAEKLNAFPARWHPYIIGASAVLIALSKSAQEVVSGRSTD
jgi:hypothetical protein